MIRPIIQTQIPGPRSIEYAQSIRQYENPNITYIDPNFPIFWEKAQGCWITDVDGNHFLDMTSAFGVASIGHSHPKVIEAIKRQCDRLIHGMGDVHPSDVKADLCRLISKNVPIKNAQTILGQNGSDAVEAALKTAILYTNKNNVLAFDGAYHGLTYGALNVTSRDDFRKPFFNQLGTFTRHLPYGASIDDIEAAIRKYDIGAVIVEPIQGRGGIQIPPAGWLKQLSGFCKQYGVLLIADEIFTGWCRTGEWFACNLEEVVPDIMCIGKAMGGGLPISACVASAELFGCWGISKGEALHTSTFLGNPLSCASSIASIHVMQDENLKDRAKDSGNVLMSDLKSLQQRYPSLISEIRGRGLMIGVQFNSAEIANTVMIKSLKHGIIVLPAGDGSVIELVPPLVIDSDELSVFIDVFQTILQSL